MYIIQKPSFGKYEKLNFLFHNKLLKNYKHICLTIINHRKYSKYTFNYNKKKLFFNIMHKTLIKFYY